MYFWRILEKYPSPFVKFKMWIKSFLQIASPAGVLWKVCRTWITSFFDDTMVTQKAASLILQVMDLKQDDAFLQTGQKNLAIWQCVKFSLGALLKTISCYLERINHLLQDLSITLFSSKTRSSSHTSVSSSIATICQTIVCACTTFPTLKHGFVTSLSLVSL